MEMTKVVKERKENEDMAANAQKEKSIVYKTDNLNLWYGNDQALKNIDLDIYENEVTAIIGPSGCGKSTYIKTLTAWLNLFLQSALQAKLSTAEKTSLIKATEWKTCAQELGWCSKSQIRSLNLFMKMLHTDQEFMESATKRRLTPSLKKA